MFGYANFITYTFKALSNMQQIRDCTQKVALT